MRSSQIRVVVIEDSRHRGATVRATSAPLRLQRWPCAEHITLLSIDTRSALLLPRPRLPPPRPQRHLRRRPTGAAGRRRVATVPTATTASHQARAPRQPAQPSAEVEQAHGAQRSHQKLPLLERPEPRDRHELLGRGDSARVCSHTQRAAAHAERVCVRGGCGSYRCHLWRWRRAPRGLPRRSNGVRQSYR